MITVLGFLAFCFLVVAFVGSIIASVLGLVWELWPRTAPEFYKKPEKIGELPLDTNMTFQQFVEGKQDDTNQLQALMKLVHAVRDTLKDYSLNTRQKAWDKLTGKKGQEEMRRLLKNPGRNLNTFRTLI